MRPQKLIEINDGINVSIKVKKKIIVFLYIYIYTSNLFYNFYNLFQFQLKGSGDENSPIVDQRTPLNILEAYAKRCKTSIEYEHNESPHRLKSSVYVIRGNLGGFAGILLYKYIINSFDIL